jgi:arylsulfatase B
MAARPNILFVLADGMGCGDFGCFNGGLSETPVLDHLVAEGVSLTQHYSASPVCAPARAALLTGRYPQRTGAIDTLELRGLDRLALRERTIGGGAASRRCQRAARAPRRERQSSAAALLAVEPLHAGG